jgi:predicted SprT family Zn-dependent metalloprotease
MAQPKRPSKEVGGARWLLCTKCQRYAPEAAFNRNHTKPDGREYRCKACRNAKDYRNRSGWRPHRLPDQSPTENNDE